MAAIASATSLALAWRAWMASARDTCFPVSGSGRATPVFGESPISYVAYSSQRHWPKDGRRPCGLGFRVDGSGFRVQGSGFGVKCVGCRVTWSTCMTSPMFFSSTAWIGAFRFKRTKTPPPSSWVRGSVFQKAVMVIIKKKKKK